MKIFTRFILLLIVICMTGCKKQNLNDLSLVPFPKSITEPGNDVSVSIESIGIVCDSETSDLINLTKDDIYRLSGVNIQNDTSGFVVKISIIPNKDKEEYRLITSKNEILIEGGSCNAAQMGWVTLLQLSSIEDGKITFPKIEINDKPSVYYRGFMLDLARSFHPVDAVKQMIDVCRWYKINFLQLHLTDSGLCVFPFKKYNKVLSEGVYYTEEQYKDILEYARVRGITIVPELEGPGHFEIFLERYPEVFGPRSLHVTDLSSEKALKAVEELLGEVIDLNPNTPYIHIGADEANLKFLAQYPPAIKKVKELGYSDVHDLYLNYLVRMNKYIKSRGKQTIAWEGFDKNGSEHLKIPKDIIVCGFETLYQRPDSLIDQGYTVINTSWKPLYVIPGRRWSVEKIYSWSYYTWENFWEATPAWKTPIVIEESKRDKILGSQMCSWEMPEEMEYNAMSKRLGAMGQRVWSPDDTTSYNLFRKRLDTSEKKLRALVYPFNIETTGLVDPDYDGIYYNRENYFCDTMSVSLDTWIPDAVLRYTSDGTMPMVDSPLFPEVLNVNDSKYLRVGLFDKNGKRLSYRSIRYTNQPLRFEFEGHTGSDNEPERCITYNGSVLVKVITAAKGGSVRYTTDGTNPTTESPKYENPVKIDSICGFKVRHFNDNGEPVGQQTGAFLCPQEKYFEGIYWRYSY